MQDKEFFSMALGLKTPWRVADVQMDMGAQRVTIIVECRCGTAWADPEAGELAIHGYEDVKNGKARVEGETISKEQRTEPVPVYFEDGVARKDNSDPNSPSYACPARFEHTKLFPNSDWEFTKWDKVDTLGFLACCGSSGKFLLREG